MARQQIRTSAAAPRPAYAAPAVESTFAAEDMPIEGTVESSKSLEERLRTIRGRCRLLAALFSIQAEAAWLNHYEPMTVDALTALYELCRLSADDLESLARQLPASIANWHAADVVGRRR